ncbi:MAG: FAD-binding protein [Verrucomicrobia bacterium]|nr:FAD-binding protein [Verrucomicrobiota bacterium]
MSPTLTPSSVTELRDAILASARVSIEGARTKPALIASAGSSIGLRQLSGITEYDPEEFTFTALAGTPLREVIAALDSRNQRLPFDPMLVESGGTLGGAFASGLSGPGRHRHGGIRDFILGIRFMDGEGRLLRLGGKVVKNAAGFDVPKFFVGSLGCFGALVDLTFKVFPRPPAQLTLRFPTQHVEESVELITRLASSRWDCDALEIPTGARHVLARLAGPNRALNLMASDMGRALKREFTVEDPSIWAAMAEFAWSPPGHALAKVPLVPTSAVECAKVIGSLPTMQVHFSAACNVAFLSWADPTIHAALQTSLAQLGLEAMMLRGDPGGWCMGRRRVTQIEAAVKHAFDPLNRFPTLSR